MISTQISGSVKFLFWRIKIFNKHKKSFKGFNFKMKTFYKVRQMNYLEI